MGTTSKNDAFPNDGGQHATTLPESLKQTADQPSAVAVSRTVQCTVQLLYAGRLGVIMEAPRTVGPEGITIGRAPPPGGLVLLDDDRVSRLHARIEPMGGSDAMQITDMRSRNGLSVNGICAVTAPLADGDLIRIGDSFLLFRCHSEIVSNTVGLHSSSAATARLLGSSPEMRTLRRRIEEVAEGDAAVLLHAESGAGKELTARAIHALSSRSKQGPFMAVNCAAIPADLAESLLFGNEKGAFSSADRAKEGYFRAAHSGTLFLDEVGDLPMAVQPKLLRAVEEGLVLPVGATRYVPVDVRIVSATNRDLITAIKLGQFRGDLYFRLANMIVELPSLRRRREDILPILLSFWERNPPRLEADLVELLLLHPWRYNVRELQTIALELKVKGQGTGVLKADHIKKRLAQQEGLDDGHLSPSRSAASSCAAPEVQGGRETCENRRDAQPPSKDELIALLRKHRGNVSAMARDAKRSRTQVERWLAAWGIDKKAFG